MSAIAEALKALRQVVLIHANVERLEASVGKIGDDIDGLADEVGSIRDRLSRLEGFVEGVAASPRQNPRLPRD